MRDKEAKMLRKILLPDNYIKLDKNLIRLLGVKHAGFLAILIDFDKYIDSKDSYIVRDNKEWFFLSVEEGENRYMLSKDEQQKLSDDLSKLGIIEFKIFGLPRKKYFSLNYQYILDLVCMEKEDIMELRKSTSVHIIKKKKSSIGGEIPPTLEDNLRQPIYSNKEQTYKDYNIPAEENKDNISLLTSDTTMYESKKKNIELNCTLPINDVTITVDKPKKKSKSNFQSNPDKYTWINERVKEFNEGLPKDRQFARPNKSGKTREEKAGNTHILGVVYDKFGEEKATEFFNYIVAKGEWRNPYSISSLKNQEEFENFYQDPQEEQPKYLGVTKWDSYKRYKNELEEPNVGSFYNDDSFYAALEYYYSTTLSGTELVKKVRERVKEINCKYNKY